MSKSSTATKGHAKAAKGPSKSSAAKTAAELSPEDLRRKEAGMAYCQQQLQLPGWFSLSSGVVFHISRVGHGAELRCPGADDECVVNYRGTLIDGTKFDSTYDRAAPSTFRPAQVIRGWGEVLQFMCEGDAWDIVVPWHQAYGSAGSPPAIPPYATLCFTIELKAVHSPPPRKLKSGEAPMPPPEIRLAKAARDSLSETMEKPFEALIAHLVLPP